MDTIKIQKVELYIFIKKWKLHQTLYDKFFYITLQKFLVNVKFISAQN